MKRLLPLILILAQQASAEVCAPRADQWYSSKDPLATRKERVLLVTHASRRFDTHPSTIQGIQAAINILSPSSEVVYIHTGSPRSYMYPHCQPDWFYKSSGGAIKLDLEASDTVVMIGGYYSLCQHQSSIGVAKALRNLKVKKDIRIVYVMDASFERMDVVDPPGEEYRVGVTFNYAMMANALAADHQRSDELIKMLSSTYRSEGLPKDYTVTAHLRNHYWKGDDWIDWSVQKADGHRIDIYYLESKDLKEFFGL